MAGRDQSHQPGTDGAADAYRPRGAGGAGTGRRGKVLAVRTAALAVGPAPFRPAAQGAAPEVRRAALRICMLARNAGLYSHRRICEAAKARGHEIQVVNTLRCYMNITSHRPELHYNGAPLEGFDAVIPRIGASVTYYGLAVLRQFEVMGVWPLNESVAIGRSRDKLRSLQLLARRGIGLPVTAFTNDSKQAEDVIDLVGGAPVVIKLLEGTQGIGVVLGETVKSAKSVIEAFQGVNVNIMVQQFIKEADATDIR